jgi:hypothetical protein
MDRTCSTHEGDDKCMKKLVWKAGREDTSENLGVNGRIILKCFSKIECEGTLN